MSIEVLNWVLQHSPAEGRARLVLIVLADKANKDGSGAYPSIETIGREARIKSKTTVRAALRTLKDDGHISYEGESDLRTRSWRVVMDRAHDYRAANWSAESEPERGPKPDPSEPDPQHITDPEPSLEPPSEQEAFLQRGGSGPAPITDADRETWQRARAALRERTPDFKWHIWLANVELDAVTGSTVTLSAPPSARSWLGERYLPAIRRALEEAFGRALTVRITEQDDAPRPAGGRTGAPAQTTEAA